MPLGCGSSSSGNPGQAPGPDAGAPVDASMPMQDAPFDQGASDTPNFGNHDATPPPNKVLQSLAVTPATGTIVATNGNGVQEQLTATGTYSDGSTGDLTTQAVWTRNQAGIGSISSSGVFSANGNLGGTETITATFGSFSGTATLVVKLKFIENPGFVATPVQSSLQATTTPDATVKWAYPYDATVFPRGINETTLMWLGGNVDDDYYVHLTAPTFELQSFSQAPSAQFDFTVTDWQSFLDSTSGPAELTVARWDGTQATTLCDLHWTIGNGSMRGTIYYAAYQVIGGVQTGDVVRIDPGSAAYTDFLGTSFACPSCHTVSASGNELVMNAGTWPQMTSYDYDLKASSSAFFGFPASAGASQWGLSAVSPDGTVVVENFAPLYGPIGVQTGAFDSTTGVALSTTGLEGQPLWMPTFSPDGLLLAYVHPTTHDLRAYDWDPVAKQASNDRLIAASSLNPASPQIQYPTVSPDHQWIVYQRGTALGSLGVPGDLFVASVANPGTEMGLGALDGASYPFAAGARDLHLNYEPTFAPVAAGGYFWLVFHSRRTYGNKLTQPAYVAKGNGVKQLWVAAFDQVPVAGTDPSHAAFYLGGQSPITLNTRGYWALSPCEPNGQACQSGTDCCGGYCDTPGDGGSPVCENAPTGGCAQNGDKCAQTADCCNAGTGVTCINSVSSGPPPPPYGGSAN